MNGVEQRDRFPRLVRLERADQMELEPGMANAQRRPFRLRLLHPVLAEYALASRNHRLDRLGAEGLGYRHKRDRGRITVSGAAGLRNLLTDCCEAGFGIDRFHALPLPRKRAKSKMGRLQQAPVPPPRSGLRF